jgi:hypothetical protein
MSRLDLPTVASAVVPGRVVRLRLAPEQREALRDHDGQLGLDVLRHLLGARFVVQPKPAPFPLTAEAFQRVAGKLGVRVGIKRSYTIIRRLSDAGIIENIASYRQPYGTSAAPSGFRVTLYRLAAKVASVRPARRQRAIGGGAVVNPLPRRRWWEHPLFGNPDGRPPPHLSAARLRRMSAADEDTLRRKAING